MRNRGWKSEEKEWARDRSLASYYCFILTVAVYLVLTAGVSWQGNTDLACVGWKKNNITMTCIPMEHRVVKWVKLVHKVPC